MREARLREAGERVHSPTRHKGWFDLNQVCLPQSRHFNHSSAPHVAGDPTVGAEQGVSPADEYKLVTRGFPPARSSAHVGGSALWVHRPAERGKGGLAQRLPSQVTRPHQEQVGLIPGCPTLTACRHTRSCLRDSDFPRRSPGLHHSDPRHLVIRCNTPPPTGKCGSARLHRFS